MRRKSLKAIVCTAAVTFAGSAAFATGCTATQPTELVPGVLSQVQVPRDLQTIELDVTTEGATKFCEYVSVYDGQVELPRTLGVVSGESPNTIVTVTIRGYTGTSSTAGSGSCPDTLAVNDPSGNGPAVLRRSVQTFVGGHTLFLPMPLSFSCFSQDCSGAGPLNETSCAASRCVDLSPQDPVANAGKLVDFTPSLVDGTDVCFDANRCFSDQVPAVPVSAGGGNDASMGPSDATTTASDCTYTFENPELEQLPGINVRIFYQDFRWQQNDAGQYVTVPTNGGEQEILNEDPDEGFTVSADGTSFTLAPGLCDLAKNAITPPPAPSTGTAPFHTISAIQAASGCPSKPTLLPLCAGQQNVPTTLADGGGLAPNLPDGGTTTDGVCNVGFPLTPAPSAMYMVMDDSAVMHAAFGMQGYATALGLSLTDPIFKQTSAAFTYLPHLDSECSGLDPDGGLATSFTTPQLGFALGAQAQPAIANKLMEWMAPGDTVANPLHLDLGAAMRLDTGAYAEVASYVNQVNEIPAVAAAMFFLNRVPTPLTDTDAGETGNDCPLVPPVTSALQALETKALAAFNAKPSMQTYFVVLDDNAHDGPTVALPFYQQMQTDVPQAVTVIDATSQSATSVLANFENVVSRLGTCLYEPPNGVTNPEQVAVSYQQPPPPGSPIGPGPVSVPVDTGCSAATQNTANGWNIDADGRVRICGQPCSDLRSAILLSSGLALQAGQTVPPDVPVSAAVLCGVEPDAAEPAPLEDAATLFPPVPEAGADAAASTDAAAVPSDAATGPGSADAGTEAGTTTDAAADAGDAGP